MTNKEKAAGLMAEAGNQALELSARRIAWNALNDLKRKAKTSFEKLGVPEPWRQQVAAELLIGAPGGTEHVRLAGPLEEIVSPKLQTLGDILDEALATQKIKPASTPKPAGDQRGLISAEVRCLLMDTDHAYSVIVEMVKAKFPDANTTTRSVASVAAELRKCGQPIAFRRPAKGV